LVEWGFLDLPADEPNPEWIQLKGNQTDEGVVFELYPQPEDATKKVTVYFVLKDEHAF